MHLQVLIEMQNAPTSMDSDTFSSNQTYEIVLMSISDVITCQNKCQINAFTQSEMTSRMRQLAWIQTCFPADCVTHKIVLMSINDVITCQNKCQINAFTKV